MKKYLYLSVAAMTLVGCSDEFLGEGAGNGTAANEKNAIVMGTRTSALSRADHTGLDAAKLLGKNFVVEGIKGDGSTQTEVFDHYNVNYTATLNAAGDAIETESANTTESNTANWEYVGQTKHALTAANAQTIKYWDYGTKQYDFVAFSYGTSNSTDLALTEIDYSNLGKTVASGDAVYTVTGKAEDLTKAYVADLLTLYNRDGIKEYGTEVTPKFRAMGAKVRLGFYETVPGYAVSNVKFYTAAWDGNATAAAGADAATLFAASNIFPSSTSDGTMEVYYPTVGWANSANNGTPAAADYNQAHIKFTTGTNPLVTTKEFAALSYTATAEAAETCSDILGRTSATATYAGDYVVVLPLGSSDNLQLRIEYDLYPIDGAEEVIHVRDARAVVPAAYADWKPNYAYTYIFKISDNTNGWTGVDGDGNVVEGLTPITLNAVVVDTEDGIQETITTFSTPSITTYQEGVVVTANDEYEAGDIYVSVMNGAATVTLNTLNAFVYEVTAGEDIVSEKLAEDQLNGVKSNTGVTFSAALTTTTIVSEVPTADGNTVAVNALKFAAESGKTYVFDYMESAAKHHVKVIKVQ